MRHISFAKTKQRINNGLVVALFVAAQIALSVSPFLTSSVSAASTGALSGTTFVGNISATSGDSDWSNANNTASSNNAYATTTVTDNSDVSNYLRSSGFGFAIPAGSTINGVTVSIERSESGQSSAEIQDNVVRLVKNNVVVGNDKSSNSNWPTSDAPATYGSTNDLWGESWSVSDINNANFGVVLSVQSNSDNDETARVDHVSITVQYTAPVAITPNPSLSQACGLDIALVIDNSTSIDSGEMTQMKNAVKSFTNALSGTPTEFSVTRFASSATVSQGFTNNTASVNAAIDAIPVGGGFTNWEDGFTKAASTLPNRINPNLVIFATDGDPTTSNTIGGTDLGQPNAHLDPAIVAANSIKAGGTRVLALGIGLGGSSVDRLKAISGPTVGTTLAADVISSDFATLAASLATFAQETCGGTVTVNKLIDADGIPGGTTTPTAGWTFNVGGQTGKVTDGNGKTAAVTLTAGSGYSVAETQQNGYTLLSATCTGAADNGTQNLNTTSVTGIAINNTNIVSCTFINAQTRGTIELKKVWSGGSGQATLNIGTSANGNQVGSQQTGANGAAPLTTGQKNVITGTYFLSESSVTTGFTGSLACFNDADNNGSQNGGESAVTITNSSVPVAAGQHVVCTFTNTRDTGSVTVTKLLDNDGNGSFETTNPATFNWNMDSIGTNAMGATVNNIPTGNHTVQENNVANYHLVGWYVNGTPGVSCANPTNTTLPANINVTKGQATAITICNAHDTGTLQVLKNVDLNSDGDYTDAGETGATNWLWTANGGSNHSTGDAAINVITGDYLLAESGPADFHFVSLSCTGGTLNNKTVTVAKNGNAVCTFVNARDTGMVSFLKQVIGGSSVASDWTFNIAGNGTAKSGDSKSYLTGIYGLTETGPTGYSATGASGTCAMDMQGLIWLTVTTQGGLCTVVNTRDTGSVKVNKLLDDNGDGVYETVNPGTFSWNMGTHTNNAMGASLNAIETGDYNVTENGPDGYHFVGWYPTNNKDYSCANTFGKTLPADISVNRNTITDITLCNARDTGTITVNKVVVGNNDTGTFDLQINGATAGTGAGVGNGGTTGKVTLPIGQYNVSEIAGDAETDLSDYSSSLTCDNGLSMDGATSTSFSLSSNQNITCTFTNVRYGHIIVTKNTLPAESDQSFHFNATYSDNGFDLKDGDSNDSGNLLPGSYTVSEDSTTGWDNIGASCSNESNVSEISLQAGQTVTCTFTNEKRSEVIVTKYNDYNHDGFKDNDEPVIPDWEFTLSCNNPEFVERLIQIIDNDCQDKTQTTGLDGTTTFTDVRPGITHQLTETIPEGSNWHFSGAECTGGEYSQRGEVVMVFVAPGATLNCAVGNYRDASLSLTKANDTPTPVNTGATVTYTLTVTVPDDSGAVFDATTTDLPPEGFAYVAGSWTASVKHADDSVDDLKAGGTTTEPTYGSPGVWNLGDLLPGDVVTLTYKTLIANTVSDGTYPDLAFATGCDVPVDGEITCPEGGALFANVTNEDNTPFVGTNVSVVSPAVLAANITRYVNTGANDVWFNTIAAITLAGAAFVTLVRREQKGAK